MKGSNESRHQPALMGVQWIDFRELEDAIVSTAATLPPEHVETFTEFAIDQVLVDFARNTRGQDASRIHMAIGRHLRREVDRKLAELRDL